MTSMRDANSELQRLSAQVEEQGRRIYNARAEIQNLRMVTVDLYLRLEDYSNWARGVCKTT